MYQQNKRYQIGNWKIDVPCDVELYQCYEDSAPEMIPHSNYGERFIQTATPQEKKELIDKKDAINRSIFFS